MEPDNPGFEPGLDAQITREEPVDELSTVDQKRRRDCVVRGAQIFAAGVAIPVLLSLFVNLLFRQSVPSWSDLFILLYVAGPPLIGLGAYQGFQFYRRAASDYVPPPTNWWVWVIAFFCLGWPTVPIFVSLRHRRLVLENNDPAKFAPIFYFIFLVLFSLLPGMDNRNLVPWMLLPILASVLCCDALLVNAIVAYRRDGKLAEPETKKFQFSLGTMLVVVWSVGAWITGLVMMLKS